MDLFLIDVGNLLFLNWNYLSNDMSVVNKTWASVLSAIIIPFT